MVKSCAENKSFGVENCIIHSVRKSKAVNAAKKILFDFIDGEDKATNKCDVIIYNCFFFFLCYRYYIVINQTYTGALVSSYHGLSIWLDVCGRLE